VRRGKDSVLLRSRHPWIYRQTLSGLGGVPAGGELLPVVSSDGRVIGWGDYSAESTIAVRMVSYGEREPPEDWLAERIRAACGLRARLGMDSDGVRILNAEGDYVPGVIADRYADTVVVSLHTRAMELRVDGIVAALEGEFPGTRVFLKRDEHHSRVEGLALPTGYLAGEGDGTAVITEGGVRFAVDFAGGQKTGFYLDQRANRTLAAGLSAGRTMLNLFSYTGAFALRAAAAGATRVVSVDSSARAVEAGRRGTELNPALRGETLEWVQADALAYLRDPGRHDVVVVDPPPFARRRSELEGALRGYVGLFHQALKSVAPGGFALLFSCSGAVDKVLFRQVVAEAAQRSGRSVRLLHELQADADHPVAPSHPEGEYLKGWLVHAQ
jgi:23S rRNA (cytosine1962-C5)-methyltransferase